MTNTDLLYLNSQDNYLGTTLNLDVLMEDSSNYVMEFTSKHELEWEYDYITLESKV